MIGLFGGTFNPIHFGHLRPAIDVVDNLNLSELIFIPCGVPPHRNMPEVTPEIRFELIQAAIHNEPKLKVDDREIHRKGISYTVDTLRAYRQERGKESICLIIGKDAFLELYTWHNWQELLQLAHLVVMHRPGYDIHGDTELISPALFSLMQARETKSLNTLYENVAGYINFQTVTQLNISSTHIRELVRQGKNISFLLPESVKQKISQLNLYR